MNNFWEKLITVSLIILIMTSFFSIPRKALAEDDDALKALGINIGALIGSYAAIPAACKGYAAGAGVIDSFLKGATDKLKGTVWDKIKEKISSKEEEGILSNAVPVLDKTVKQRVKTESEKTRFQDRERQCTDFLKDVVLTQFKKRLLDRLVDETVRWIQGEGEPQFISDPNKFYKDIRQAAIGDIALDIGASELCYEPQQFRLQFQLKQPVFSERVACTLDDIVGNIAAFKDNFANGGWIAYQETLKPQNNPAGLELLTQQEVMRRTSEAQLTAGYESTVGSGFLGQKRCLKWKATKDIYDYEKGDEISGSEFYRDTPGPNSMKYTGKTELLSNGWRCADSETITPGRVASEAITKALGSEYEFIANAENLSAYGAAILNALMNRVIKMGSEGLAYATKTEKSCEDFEDPILRRICESEAAESIIPGSSKVIENLGIKLENATTTLILAEDEWEKASSTASFAISILGELKECQENKGEDATATIAELTALSSTTIKIDEAINNVAANYKNRLNTLETRVENATEANALSISNALDTLQGELEDFFIEATELNVTLDAKLSEIQEDLSNCETPEPPPE